LTTDKLDVPARRYLSRGLWYIILYIFFYFSLKLIAGTASRVMVIAPTLKFKKTAINRGKLNIFKWSWAAVSTPPPLDDEFITNFIIFKYSRLLTLKYYIISIRKLLLERALTASSIFHIDKYFMKSQMPRCIYIGTELLLHHYASKNLVSLKMKKGYV